MATEEVRRDITLVATENGKPAQMQGGGPNKKPGVVQLDARSGDASKPHWVQF